MFSPMDEAGLSTPDTQSIGLSRSNDLLIGVVAPILLGVAFAAASYLFLAHALKVEGNGVLATFRERIVSQGPIPIVCLWLLFWVLSFAFLRYFARIRQEDASLVSKLLPDDGEVLTDARIADIRQRAVEIERVACGSLMTKRLLLAVDRISEGRSICDIRRLLDCRASEDLRKLANDYWLPNAAMLAMPICGFMGTAVDLNRATSKVRRGINGLDTARDLTASVTATASELAGAFDFTLLAMAMTVVAFLVLTIVHKKETQLQAAVSENVEMRFVDRIASAIPECQVTHMENGA